MEKIQEVQVKEIDGWENPKPFQQNENKGKVNKEMQSSPPLESTNGKKEITTSLVNSTQNLQDLHYQNQNENPESKKNVQQQSEIVEVKEITGKPSLEQLKPGTLEILEKGTEKEKEKVKENNSLPCTLPNINSQQNQMQNQYEMKAWGDLSESYNSKTNVEDKKNDPLLGNKNQDSWNFSSSSSNHQASNPTFESIAQKEYNNPNTVNSSKFSNSNYQDSNVEVFIRNLPYQISENEVREAFSICGSITRVSIPLQNGKPRGFGFIAFSSNEGCKKAVEMDQQIKLGSRQISVTMSTKSSNPRPKPAFQGEPSKTLFMGNLPVTITEEDIKSIFQSASIPTQIRISRKDGVFKGFAHVDFDSIDDAKKALELNPSFEGRVLKLNFASSRPPRGDNQKSGDFRGKRFQKGSNPDERDRSREREYGKNRESNSNSSSNFTW